MNNITPSTEQLLCQALDANKMLMPLAAELAQNLADADAGDDATILSVYAEHLKNDFLETVGALAELAAAAPSQAAIKDFLTLIAIKIDWLEVASIMREAIPEPKAKGKK